VPCIKSKAVLTPADKLSFASSGEPSIGLGLCRLGVNVHSACSCSSRAKATLSRLMRPLLFSYSS
jgi:hypothetical protein